MNDAETEAWRRIDEIRGQIGFPDEIATWWVTGFRKGAEWQNEQKDIS